MAVWMTEHGRHAGAAARRPGTARPKPAPADLGVDLANLEWRRSGAGDGSFEVAFSGSGSAPCDGAGAQWVLLRVAGDLSGRVLIYDRVEWACFLDGVRGGEFDLRPGPGGQTAPSK
jgi:hypothetical protein